MDLNLRRFTFYTAGILILTFGIALTIISQMGTGPFDALLVGLYFTFGLTIGSWEIVVGLSMVLCNALAEKRRPEFLTLCTSFLTGMGIDLWMYLLSDWIQPGAILGRSICFAVGLIFVGLGVAVNLQSNFAPNPMDRSMQVLTKLTGWNFGITRALISIVLVILAFFFDGPIAVGTIISALFAGVIIKFFMPFLARLYEKRSHPQESLSS